MSYFCGKFGEKLNRQSRRAPPWPRWGMDRLAPEHSAGDGAMSRWGSRGKRPAVLLSRCPARHVHSAAAHYRPTTDDGRGQHPSLACPATRAPWQRTTVSCVSPSHHRCRRHGEPAVCAQTHGQTAKARGDRSGVGPWIYALSRPDVFARRGHDARLLTSTLSLSHSPPSPPSLSGTHAPQPSLRDPFPMIYAKTQRYTSLSFTSISRTTAFVERRRAPHVARSGARLCRYSCTMLRGVCIYIFICIYHE